MKCDVDECDFGIIPGDICPSNNGNDDDFEDPDVEFPPGCDPTNPDGPSDTCDTNVGQEQGDLTIDLPCGSGELVATAGILPLRFAGVGQIQTVQNRGCFTSTQGLGTLTVRSARAVHTSTFAVEFILLAFRLRVWTHCSWFVVE